MSQRSDHQETISSGVEELIQRLKADGVAAGRDEAEALLGRARAEAEHLLAEGRAEADRYREQAEAAAEARQQAATSALEQAVRDSLLSLEQQVREMFAVRLGEALRRELEDPGLLRALVLGAAGDASAGVAREDVAVELPRSIEGESSAALAGTLSITRDMLRDGVRLRAGRHEAGVVLRLEDKELAIDLSETALASLVLEQLAPSFRSVLRGLLESEPHA